MVQLLPIAASACPSLYRLAPARDGGICRIKLPLGRIALPQARAVAEAGARWGNGTIEMTSRSNLQLRGVADADAGSVAAFLLGAGLAPKNPAADDVRNVMVAPMAGFDSGQHADISAIAESLLARLQSESRWFTLSPKFSILIDAGERLTAVSHPHDIWASVTFHDGEPVALIGVAGPLPTASGDSPAIAAVPLALLEEALGQVIDAVLETGATRMRDFLALHDQATLAARITGRLPTESWIADWRRPVVSADSLGLLPEADGLSFSLGFKPALGRLDPQSFFALLDALDTAGVETLHLTPFQSFLVPHLSGQAANALQRAVEALGLLTIHSDPLAQMVACSGSTGCSKARSATQADAHILAALLPGSKTIHLTGCDKSCASAAAAPFTLVGVGEGRYDVFARDPSGSRFGASIARDIGISDAASLLARR